MAAVDPVLRDAYDVVVVGAGVFGLATAGELARRGLSVLAIDRFGSGHPATSSTGASRSIRIAYDHPVYVGLALEAIEGWRRLEAETGRAILHLTGQVDIGPARKLDDLVRTVTAAGAAIEEVDRARPAPCGSRSSSSRRARPPSSSARPARSCERRHGGAAHAGRAGRRDLPAEAARGPHRARSARHRAHAGRQLPGGAGGGGRGPLLGGLLDGIGLHLPLAPAIAQVTFLDAPAMVDRPGIAEWPPAGETGVYGHPVPGVGYKIAFDAGSEGWDPDVEAWAPDAAEEARILAWLARRMPSVEPVVRLTQRHPWTMTPDVDFIVDRRGPLVVAGGCSGHAFKFGPALGRLRRRRRRGRRPTRPVPHGPPGARSLRAIGDRAHLPLTRHAPASRSGAGHGPVYSALSSRPRGASPAMEEITIARGRRGVRPVRRPRTFDPPARRNARGLSRETSIQDPGTDRGSFVSGGRP